MARPQLRSAAGVVTAAVLLIVLPSLLLSPAAGPAPRHPSAPNLSLAPRTGVVRLHSTYYPVQGTLVGLGARPVPIANASVVLADRLCAGLVSPASCTTVNRTTTDANGTFGFTTVNGSYYVYTNNSSRWGGAWATVDVAGGSAALALRAYPWVPYGNASFVLPDWSNLTGRADNCNAQIPCGRAPYGTQVPVLSWTQDGAVYVNATDELVFYSFANRSVTALGPWVPLYDDLMGYPGIENTEWLTQDGSYAYELGCLSACTNSTPVTFYAVNVSTGRSFEHNFTGFTDSALYNNGQLNLVGLDGNDSVAALFLDNSSVYAYNLWNQTQWVLGDLAFFEANNVYWLPAYDRFVDVEAQGSASDRIVEYQLTGAGAGSSLSTCYSGTYASSYVSNGVDGLFVNVSSHQFLVSESKHLGDLRSQLYSFDPNGTITALNRSFPSAGLGAWPQDGAVPNSYSSEHRVSLVASGPMFMGFWNGLFDNGSWMYDPATGGFLATNVSFDDNQSASATYHEEHQNPNQVEGLFFNTSYSILGASVDCQNGRDQCAIRGTLPGTSPGTVWWTWRQGLPEFPYPASAALAQPLPPSLLAITGVGNGSAVRLNWTPPAEAANPILNYTIFWGSSPTALGSVLNLPGSARSAVIGGLVPGSVIYYRAYAWNLHWHGPAANGIVTTTLRSHLIRSFSANRTPDDVGLPVYLEVNLSVPSAGVNFSYSNLPAGCPSANGPVLLCVPAGAGLYSITVLVSATNGTADYANLTLLVNPDVAIQAWSVPSPIGANTSSAFSVSIGATGTAPYSVLWSFGDGAQATRFSASHAYSAPGAYYVQVNVTDALGDHAAYSAVVEVLPPIQLSTTVSPSPAEVNRIVRLNATIASGGQAPYSYLWSLPGPNRSSELSLIFPSAGVVPVTLTVTDSIGLRAVAAFNLTVEPAPAISSARASPSATDLGRPTTVVVNESGGVAPFTYSFQGLPAGCAAADVARLPCVPAATGTFSIAAVVTDALGVEARSTISLLVNPPLSIRSFASSVSAPIAGEPFGLALAIAGGTGPWGASFTGLGSSCRPAGGPLELNCTFPSAGSYPVTANVTDAVGASAGAELTLAILPGNSTVGGSHGPGGLTLTSLLYPAAVVALAVALIAVVVAGRRRRPPPEPEAPPGRDPTGGPEPADEIAP